MSLEERADSIIEALPNGETEDAVALSFCTANPHLRFVAKWNKWMVWDGGVWREDTTLGVFDKVRQHVRRNAENNSLLRAGAVTAIEKLARSDRRCAATVDQWDANDWLLNTPKRVIDLRTGKNTANDPSDYLSKSTKVSPTGGCPTWHRFLAEVTNGDVAYQSFLQRVAGYAASGSTKEHALFFLYGVGGNGKGVFLNTIQSVMGDYAITASMETFTESKSDRHPTDLAMLRAARIVVAQETEEGRAWAESRIKALTGGDAITARYMRQDFFTYEPKFKLLIAGNHKPRLRNVDEAMKRRLHLLPFTMQFSGERRDPDLPDKLRTEHGGVLSWIVDGGMAYQSQGLNPPHVVQEATAAYFEAEDVFDQWLADCCVVSPDAWERPATLFNSWKDYANAANEHPGNQKQFNDRLEQHEFTRHKDGSHGGRYWRGLKVTNMTEVL